MTKLQMRYGCVLAILVSFLAGCGGKKPASERVLGSWEGQMAIDDAAMEKFMKENNIPAEFQAKFKEGMEKDRLFISFEEGGTGKVGSGTADHAHIDEMTWKVESEEGDKATIAITDDHDETVKLDLTFKEDGTIVGKIIPPEGEKSMPDTTVTLKKIEKLPEDAHAGESDHSDEEFHKTGDVDAPETIPVPEAIPVPEETQKEPAKTEATKQ